MSSFDDLKIRLLSAIVMIVVGLSAIWMGGLAFLALLAIVGGLMIWELARMLAPKVSSAKIILLAIIAGVSVLRVGYDTQLISLVSLLIAPAIGLVLLPHHRGLFAIYATAILFAISGLFWLRLDGLEATIWLVLVVVGSDVGGYFAGRIFGGPKIAPKISPKKTWSGTLGGWLLAAMIGVGFVFWAGAGSALILISVLVAIAAQIGDVVESAVKRLSKIKDSSNLIPGHGGFLDRFDAMIGASLFVLVITAVLGLPLLGVN